MVEVTQEDRDTLDAATVEWCMGDNNVSLEIIAAYRQAIYQRGKLEGARLALEAAADRCDFLAQFPLTAREKLGASIRALDPAKIVDLA